MKNLRWLAACLGLLAGCEQHPSAHLPTATPPVVAAPVASVPHPKDAVQGDFDGDGTMEYVWLVPPEIDSTGEDCVGECASRLLCSNPALRPFALKPSIGGELAVYHHLGAGRRDYLGITPSWFTSCWSSYYVLTYRPGGWKYGVEPFSTHCDQWENDVIPIARDSAHAGHVLIRYTDMASDDFAVKTKSVLLH